MMKDIEQQCAEIADKVCGGPPVRCWGWKAKIWQAAWDAAYAALGGDLDSLSWRQHPEELAQSNTLGETG